MYKLTNVRYKDILDIDELTISEEKVTCLVGESGSGKTTLLRMLNKIISPDDGEILFKDQDLAFSDSIELRRRAVMLPQMPAIFPGSIADNLQMGLIFSGQQPAESQELMQALEMVYLNK